MKPAIAIDANHLGSTSLQQSLQFRVYQQLSKHLGREIVLPLVAWREHLHHLYEELFGTFGSDASNAKSEGQAVPQWAETKAGRQTQAKRAVDTYEVTVGPSFHITDEYSREELKNAFDREIWRIAPASDGKGGRDSLIWLDVCKLLNEGRDVILFSGDGKAFGEGQQEELLEEVPPEFRRSIHFVSNLQELLEFASVTSVSGIDDAMATEIIQDAINKRMVTQYLLLELTNYVPRALFTETVFSPGSVNNVTLEILGKPYGFQLENKNYIAFKANYSGDFAIIFDDSENINIWIFGLKGFVSLIAEIDDTGTFAYDIVNLSFDRSSSVIRPPEGGEITFAEARKIKRDEGEGFEYRLVDA